MVKNSIFLFSFVFLLASLSACANKPNAPEKFEPYLENSKHVQIPQWQTQNWYLEDWTSQKPANKILADFYRADIFEDQITNADKVPVLVVGKNFYHLSGFDKRRAVMTVDEVYNITKNNPDAGFLLQDWRTKKYIGAYDQNGLRLQ